MNESCIYNVRSCTDYVVNECVVASVHGVGVVGGE